MRSIFLIIALLAIVGIVTADEVTALICPFDEPGEGMTVPGYSLESGFTIESGANEGFIMSRLDLWQQAGGGNETTVSESQGYTAALNGQGSWNYSGRWSGTEGNQISTERSLVVLSGRMNPEETFALDGKVCPPAGETYNDTLTHTLFAETAIAENRGDISSGRYAAIGYVAPGQLDSAMGITGEAWGWSSAGYNAMTGIAQNVTEDVTYTGYTMVGKVAVPYTYTVTESRTEVIKTGWTRYTGYVWQGGHDMHLVTTFHFKSTKNGV